jgi:uncharacterized protein (TIGR02996 family)
MNDDVGFLAEIRTNPLDDATRLIYADWLDERGDVRGEYLRLDLQLNPDYLRLAELRQQIDPLWLAAVSKRRLCRSGPLSIRKIPVINIVNDETVLSHAEQRRYILQVLLLAVKDRATELRFERSETPGLWNVDVRYQIGSGWHQMVPLPYFFNVPQDFRYLARIPPPSIWRRLFGWRNDNEVAYETPICLMIAGKSVELDASFHPSRSGSPSAEIVVLRFPEAGIAVEEAKFIFYEVWRKWPVAESPAG